jgi:hypothetical protein
VDQNAIYRRAGGRRRYNAARRRRRDERRRLVFQLHEQLLNQCVLVLQSPWSIASIIARHLGVSRSTICRDLQAMPDRYKLGPRGPWWPSMNRRAG